MTELQTSLPQKDGYFTLTKSGPQKMKNEMYFSPQKIIKVPYGQGCLREGVYPSPQNKFWMGNPSNYIRLHLKPLKSLILLLPNPKKTSLHTWSLFLVRFG